MKRDKEMMAEALIPAEVLRAFCDNALPCRITSLGHGNINDTFLVHCDSSPFVLQRINGDVFPQPKRVIKNFLAINNHLSLKQRGKGEELLLASPVLSLDGQLFVQDSTGSFWRGQSYLSHKNIRTLTSTEQAQQVGKTLALFHHSLLDLDGDNLLDPLPGFHYLPGYLADYDLDLQKHGVSDVLADPQGILQSYCVTTIERYRARATSLEDAKAADILRLQPIHGDPKVDNFIFDESGQAKGLLDLDTVTLGLVHHDLGDCLRSCCNLYGENGEQGQAGREGLKSLERQPISFNLNFCQALLKGYFSGPKPFLSKKQCEYVFDGLLLICFELGLRFYTDYLRGNIYFKIERDDDNLHRAVRQFQLTEDVAGKEDRIRAIVKAASS